jgi:alpha-D-ribose 1-methylphosphonate 5-triphosphate synthase subunit PhnH
MILKIDNIWKLDVQQKIFRSLLTCMSTPGEIADLSEYLGKSSALLGILATLLDRTVSWNDADELVKRGDRHLLQAPIDSPQTAQFIVRDAQNPPLSNFVPNVGDLSNPEKGATLILQGRTLGIGNISLQLSGAGVKTPYWVSLKGFHSEWFIHRQEWVANFPLGVDMILVDFNRIMALPRTTHINIKESI